MKDDTNSDDELARDLGYALWRSPFRVRGKNSQGIEICVAIARDAIGHLRRCLWRFDKLPPPEPHGPSGMKPAKKD